MAYAISQTTDRLLSTYFDNSKSTMVQKSVSQNGEMPMPSISIVRQLNQQATSKLAEMTRQGNKLGYTYAEIVAARALLDKSTQAR